ASPRTGRTGGAPVARRWRACHSRFTRSAWRGLTPRYSGQRRMAGHVLLTRPEGKNEVLAGRLSEAGLSPLVLPALQLSPISIDPGNLLLASAYGLLMFVSRFAAQCYPQLLRRHQVGWPPSSRPATGGHGSARVLLLSGLVPPACVMYPQASTGNNDS